MTNQARISAINIELNRLRHDCITADSSLRRIRAKLETLRSAEHNLKKLLDNYSDFPTKYSNLDNSIWDSQFRGSLRRGFQENLNEIKSHLLTLKGDHRDRHGSISNAIRTTENEEGSLVTRIRVISNKISLLEQERRALL